LIGKIDEELAIVVSSIKSVQLQLYRQELPESDDEAHLRISWWIHTN
jgi:hypothetical protein